MREGQDDYDNTNSGALFKNEEKDAEHPNWADYRGSLSVQCPHCRKATDFWLNAWLKVAKKTKKKYMSVTVNAKEQRPAAQPPPRPQPDLSDDIPF